MTDQKTIDEEDLPSFSGMRDRWLKDEENGVCQLPETTPHHSKVSFVEMTSEMHGITVTERWIPAKDGDNPQALFGNWKDGFTSMTLEGRYINGKRI